MSRNRIAFILMVAVMLAVIIYASYGMLDTRRTEEEYSISVIVDNSSSDRWTAFREGLEQGNSEGNVFVNFVSTDTFHSVSEEAEVIRRELENGVDGLIVEPFASETGGELEGVLSKTGTLLICTEIPGEKKLDTVMPDWQQMGIALAQRVNEAEQSPLKSDARLRVGILSGNQRQIQMANCLQGVKEALDAAVMEVSWVSSGQAMENEAALEHQMQAKSADILISLDDEMTRLAVGYLKSKDNNNCRLYAVGRSEQSIASLDEGWIRALIVPDEYFMGYACVKTMLQKLNHFVAEAGAIDVPFVSVTKETLYDEENATLLFPVIR